MPAPPAAPTLGPDATPAPQRPSRSPTLAPSTSPSTGPSLRPTRAVPREEALPHNDVATAIAAAAGAATGSPLLPTQYALIASWCGGRVPSALHPLRFNVSGSPQLGALVGNAIAAAGLGLLLSNAMMLRRALLGRGCCSKKNAKDGAAAPGAGAPVDPDEIDTVAAMRFPGLAWLIFLMFHQGLIAAALRLVVDPQASAGSAGPGALRTSGVLAAAALAGWAVALVRSVVPPRGPDGRPVARFAQWDPQRRPPGLQRVYFLGDGAWVSAKPEPHWAVGWQMLLQGYRGDPAPRRALAGALVLQWALALAHSVKADDLAWCAHGRSLSALVLFLYTLWTVGAAPYRTLRDNRLVPLALALQSAGCAALAWGYYSEYWRKPGGWGGSPCKFCEDAGVALMGCAFALLVLKIGLDALAAAVDVSGSFRWQQQMAEWSRADRASESSVCSGAERELESLPTDEADADATPGEFPLLSPQSSVPWSVQLACARNATRPEEKPGAAPLFGYEPSDRVGSPLSARTGRRARFAEPHPQL